jgi:hypothetical protein
MPRLERVLVCLGVDRIYWTALVRLPPSAFIITYPTRQLIRGSDVLLAHNPNDQQDARFLEMASVI